MSKTSFLDSVHYFGIDQLEIGYVNPSFDFCREVDLDNSNYGFVDIHMHWVQYSLTYESFVPRAFGKSFMFSIAVKDPLSGVHKSVPLFSVIYGAEKANIISDGKIVFYSSFFVVTQNGMLPFSVSDFIAVYFPLFSPNRFERSLDLKYHVLHEKAYKILRLDIACDVSTPLVNLIKRFDKVDKFYAEIGRDKVYEKMAQTYYTNDTQRWKNKYKLVRIYDKLLDSFKKNKTWLFPHLNSGGEMRRIELELRIKCTEAIPYNLLTLLESPNNEITELFCSHMSKYSSFFPKTLKNLTKRDYGKDEVLLADYWLKYHHLPDDYIASFSWYARKIINAIWNDNFLNLLQVQLWISDKDIAQYLKINNLAKFRRCP